MHIRSIALRCLGSVTQHKVFGLVAVGALLIAASSLRPSNDQAGGDASVHANEKPDAALDRFAVAAGVPGAGLQWCADIATRIEEEEYRVSQTARGLQAPNRAHNLRTQFEPGGIDVGPRNADEGEPAWRLTWRTTRWGRANQLVDIESRESEPRLEGERVTYAIGAIDEWYENRKEGLEQGFTIHERPAGSGPLIVAGQLGGGLRPQLAREKEAIDLLDEHGARVLRYGGLHVWDAGGDELPSHLELDGTDVALVIDDEDAVYPLTIDPILTSPSWTAESDQANAEFGYSVATAGDVNGDGFSDVIVGAWKYDNGESDEGRAYVFIGSPNGLSATPAWTAEGDQANARFGVSVASAGDVNGDGFCDVIVGATGYAASASNKGRAFLYFGSAAGLVTSPAWTADGGPTSELGRSVATAGDVNGDGFSDVIVGAWFADNGQTDEGQAFVYHGAPSGLAASPAWTGEANQASAFYGFSVATAGDVNGDGFSDVIVGAWLADNGQTDEGRAFVYHGSAVGLATTAAWTGESNQTNAFYGWSVSTAGDVDGDGFCDVIVGSYSYDNTPADEGAAFVYRGSGLGLATTAAWSFESGQSNSEFGVSVATAGDVNGDGFADVIVGAPSYDNGETNEGRATIYRGSATGFTGAIYWNADSDNGGAFFGGSVATAGDVNGDGFSDVIVGAWGFDNGATNEGQAFVYHGSADGPASFRDWFAESNQSGSEFGYSVATAGDVNGDGFSDVIIGAPYFDNGFNDDRGRAFVYYGSAGGLEATASWIAESSVARRFGNSVGTAGDVNGDGYADVIVGAPDFSGSPGRAFVYLGSVSGLAASPAWAVESEQVNSEFGVSVGSAGDVNGDGFSDVIVGARVFGNGQDFEGAAFVYLGSASGLSTTTAWTAESNQANAFFGNSVGTAGDVNGDGFSDVIVGSSSYDNGQDGEGRAFVYHGSAAGLATSIGWAAESNQVGAGFGASVATAGDVNGDGFSDVIVGAPSFDSMGRAFVYLGSFAGLVNFPSWTSENTQMPSFLGTCVGTAGDVNGDGFSDVIVGATLSGLGKALIYAGNASGVSSSNLWFSEGDQPAAQFGHSVCSAGDVNGDGFSDVVVGAPLFDNGHNEEGRAFVYYGNRGDGLDSAPRQLRTDGAAPIGVLGRSDSPTGFRLEALGRTAAGRGRVRLQHEVKPFGAPFDGTGLSTGTVFDTGIPTFGVGSAIELSGLVSGLNADALYRWRLRIVSDSPFFPHSRWFMLAANGSGEADLRTASASTGVVGALPAAAGSVWLEPLAPNPFSTVTELAYTLPEPRGVRLAVYDASGREVVVLADEFQDAGAHTTTWDGRTDAGRNLPAGVYFARLESGGRVEARKVVLAR
jgi:FG-GAP repeat/FlgD Ig-like domain/FG-GAP-like repeat